MFTHLLILVTVPVLTSNYTTSHSSRKNKNKASLHQGLVCQCTELRSVVSNMWAHSQQLQPRRMPIPCVTFYQNQIFHVSKGGWGELCIASTAKATFLTITSTTLIPALAYTDDAAKRVSSWQVLRHSCLHVPIPHPTFSFNQASEQQNYDSYPLRTMLYKPDVKRSSGFAEQACIIVLVAISRQHRYYCRPNSLYLHFSDLHETRWLHGYIWWGHFNMPSTEVCTKANIALQPRGILRLVWIWSLSRYAMSRQYFLHGWKWTAISMFCSENCLHWNLSYFVLMYVTVIEPSH